MSQRTNEPAENYVRGLTVLGAIVLLSVHCGEGYMAKVVSRTKGKKVSIKKAVARKAPAKSAATARAKAKKTALKKAPKKAVPARKTPKISAKKVGVRTKLAGTTPRAQTARAGVNRRTSKAARKKNGVQKRTTARQPRRFEHATTTNRILLAIARRRPSRRNYAEALKSVDVRPVELAPAFQTLRQEEPESAGKLVEAYAVSLPQHKQHREFFQNVVNMERPDRLAAVAAYKHAGQGKGVVQAIALLPRAHSRTLMRDFLYGEREEVDREAMHSVLV